MASEGIDPADVARELFPKQKAGFPFDGFSLADLKLPEDDDMGIPSDDDDLNEEDVATETGFGSVIVVSNIPAVPAEKVEKLLGVIRKIYSSIGAIRDDGLHMPTDAAGASKGFAFIEFLTPAEAQAAREQTQGYKLDKAHAFVVNMFDDFDRYAKVPDEYAVPPVPAYTGADHLHGWLMDKLGRDQFAIRFGDDTAVCWNDGKRGRSDDIYRRQFWTESFVQWSPRGNLLATIHRQGVAAWGGPQFVRLQRFSHPGVRLIEFSPCEKYLVTYSSHEPTHARDAPSVTLIVHDVRTGRKLRVFEGHPAEFAIGASAAGAGIKWPLFKWAGGSDDLYFARLGKNMLSVYACPDMGLLDKRSLKLEAVHDFEFSPSDPLLAAYTAEQGNLSARIALIRIPDRVEVRQKTLFSVSDVRLFWHPQGDYLAVQVDRFTKSKKGTYTGFELFSMREESIPMEVMELPNKVDKVLAFAWEPRGHRFCVVHGDGARPAVSFYSMRDEKGRLGVRLIGSLASKSCNAIFWSPLGKHIVLAGLKNLNGQLEFFSVDDFDTIVTAEHFMCTDIEWDPTGRYVTTSVTSLQQMENGFNVWSFAGRLLYAAPRDRLFQFSWRPRPPTLLPPDKEAEVVRNLKTFSKRYDEEDEALLQQADADVLQERARLQDEWKAWVEASRAYVAERAAYRLKMYGPKEAEPEFTMQKVSVEHTISVVEEPYQTSS